MGVLSDPDLGLMIGINMFSYSKPYYVSILLFVIFQNPSLGLKTSLFIDKEQNLHSSSAKRIPNQCLHPRSKLNALAMHQNFDVGIMLGKSFI